MDREKGLKLLEKLEEKVKGQLNLFKSLKDENGTLCCTEFDLQRKRAEMLACASWEPDWFGEYHHMYAIGLYREPEMNFLKETSRSFIKRWEKEAQEDIYLLKEEEDGLLEESLSRIHKRILENDIPPIDESGDRKGGC